MTLSNDAFKKIEQISEKVASKHTEELAVIVVKGFQGQREYMDGRFAKIEGTLEDHGHHLQRIDQRLQSIASRPIRAGSTITTAASSGQKMPSGYRH